MSLTTAGFVERRAIPRRVLIVEQDSQALESMGALLSNNGFEAFKASDGEEALTILARRWFPLVLIDQQAPVMDGIEFSRRMRALAVKSTYIIMITDSSAAAEMEKGYCAGVDHYLFRKTLAADLVSRVRAGFEAMRLRRAPQRHIPNDDIVGVDLASGAHSARHLIGRLNAEINLALHRSRRLDLLIVGVESRQQNSVGVEQIGAVLRAIKDAIRVEADWVAWLHAVEQVQRFALIIPNAGGKLASIEQGIRNAFVAAAGSGDAAAAPKLSFGAAAVEAHAETKPVGALELLAYAEHARRMNGSAKS